MVSVTGQLSFDDFGAAIRYLTPKPSGLLIPIDAAHKRVYGFTMSIIQLRSFVEVYRQGSVSKAARALGLTQPAVSGHIASLEAQIERKLFTRHARGVSPTVIADELARRVSLSLDIAENALAEVKARSAVLSGTIHLCGPSDILSDLIANRIKALTASGLAVHLSPANDTAQIEMLLEGRADFAFSVRPSDDPRIGMEVYGQEEMLLVAAPAVAEQIAHSPDLANGLRVTPYLTYDVERYVVHNWLEYNGIELALGQEAIIAPDLRALRNFVVQGLGWSVIPSYLVRSALSDGALVEVKGSQGNLLMSFHLLWLKSAMRNPRTARAKALLTQPHDPE